MLLDEHVEYPKLPFLDPAPVLRERSVIIILLGTNQLIKSISTGEKYNQTLILNDDYTLNEEKLAEQGLPWYAASQLLYKISRTMYIGAAITHFFLWHSKTVWRLIKESRVRV